MPMHLHHSAFAMQCFAVCTLDSRVLKSLHAVLPFPFSALPFPHRRAVSAALSLGAEAQTQCVLRKHISHTQCVLRIQNVYYANTYTMSITHYIMCITHTHTHVYVCLSAATRCTIQRNTVQIQCIEIQRNTVHRNTVHRNTEKYSV